MTTTSTAKPELQAPPDELSTRSDALGRTAPAYTANGQTYGIRLAFSVHEAALMLGVSDKTVRRLISRGLLRPSRAIRHHLIPKKEIERFLDETTT